MFPLAENVDEFKEKLYRKENMISKVSTPHPLMPDGFGLLKDKTRFDAGCFGKLLIRILVNPWKWYYSSEVAILSSMDITKCGKEI